MAQIIIRDLDDNVLAQIKLRAKRNGRSVAAEVRTILSEAVGLEQGERRPLTSFIGMVRGGRTQAEIDVYVRGLRDEWEK